MLFGAISQGVKDFLKRHVILMLVVNAVQLGMVAILLASVLGALPFGNGLNGADNDDLALNPKPIVHECDRVCVEDEKPKECYYEFKIELFNTLSKACWDCPLNLTDCDREHCISADGVERGIIVVNRMMPGPMVAVCQGDKVIVDVINHLHTEVTSMHFHGEHMNGYQYMDGVPHITQCPINPASKFRYSFEAVVPGTHFYHSHNSFQRGDGAFGPYIVREKASHDAHRSLYDHDLSEHVIFPQEWFHISSREAFVLHHWDTGKNKADNILINGKGRFQKYINNNREEVATPNEVFHVVEGQRYRFRVINPGFTLCPIQVSVDDHELVMIASDGADTQPLPVKSFVLAAGERYDFILEANQTPGTYLMRFGGLFDCAPTEAHGVALLHYEGTFLESLTNDTNYEDSINIVGPVLGPVNYAPYNPFDFKSDMVPINRMKGIPRNCQPFGSETSLAEENMSDILKRSADLYSSCERPADLRQEKADKIFYLGFDLFAKDNPHYHDEDLYSYDNAQGGNKLRTPQINNVTLLHPSRPVLTQESGIDPDSFCDDETLKTRDCGESEFCECIYVLRVDLNDIVEFVMIDEGVPYDVSHPFHLHGHAFHVVAMERHVANESHFGPKPFPGNWLNKQVVIDMDQKGLIERNLIDPPLKDVATVPDGGFTIFRFQADNPGYWLFHCHMSWHNHLGMGFVLKVGDLDKDLPRVPQNFPTCGDFP
ncbi:hypothetical protein TCAL_12804 [Tigriopus californicus]|uniref:Plastocyanin-like domain-containing protein n=1 Tax=Tigriopus californicus TaxID=6832 RepID=A0A553P867_TIGCA|nr:uncharacterized protein LOC131877919 [Tigriopus californicus]TRY73881.1 hypothetical protein TCAL_12804 [Tigriopus californicus]